MLLDLLEYKCLSFYPLCQSDITIKAHTGQCKWVIPFSVFDPEGIFSPRGRIMGNTTGSKNRFFAHGWLAAASLGFTGDRVQQSLIVLTLVTILSLFSLLFSCVLEAACFFSFSRRTFYRSCANKKTLGAVNLMTRSMEEYTQYFSPWC